VEVLELSESEAGGVKEVSAIVEARRLEPPEVRGRHPSRPARPGHRVLRTHPHLGRDGRRAARGRRRRDRGPRQGPAGRSILRFPDRAVRASTPPTRRCASPICRPGSSSRARTSAARSRTARRRCALLRSRLLEAERERNDAALAAERRRMVGSGDRSEKIRTYNFPQNRVTDHRIGLTVHQLPTVLDGGLDVLIEPLVEHGRARALEQPGPGPPWADPARAPFSPGGRRPRQPASRPRRRLGSRARGRTAGHRKRRLAPRARSLAGDQQRNRRQDQHRRHSNSPAERLASERPSQQHGNHRVDEGVGRGDRRPGRSQEEAIGREREDRAEQDEVGEGGERAR